MSHGEGRCRRFGGLLSVAVIAGCGCSWAEQQTSPCDPDRITSAFVGTWTQAGPPVAMEFREYEIRGSMSPTAFAFVADVLGRGAPTLPGTVVWSMPLQSRETGSLELQLGRPGSPSNDLPLVGVNTRGRPWGSAPAFSALIKEGVAALFLYQEFLAVQGTGTLQVQSIAPLKGTLDFNLVSASGESGRLQGSIVVTLSSTTGGC